MREHPYAKEIRCLCDKLKACGFEPLYNDNGDERVKLKKDWDVTVSEILAVDFSDVILYCPKTERKFAIRVVLGNEPGIALADWAAKPGSYVWESLERISKEVEKAFDPYANAS